jgi:sugar lactone lactonase YvrE
VTVGPRGIAVDGAGNVYATDPGNDRIEKFNSTGTFLSKWGKLGPNDGELNSPSGVTVDGAGDVYVADTYNHRMQRFDSEGTFLTRFNLVPEGNNGNFNRLKAPYGAAFDSDGNIYVADTYNHRIQKFACP